MSQNMPVNFSAYGISKFVAKPIISDCSCDPVVLATCAKSAAGSRILHRTVQYPIIRAWGDRRTSAGKAFWRRRCLSSGNGFADTSLQDLEKATGVNKSGLYA